MILHKLNPLFTDNIAIIVKLIQVYGNNIVFTLRIRLFCIKLLIISISTLFLISIQFFFTFFVFIYMIRDSLNIDNHSKTFKNAFSINIMLNLLERSNKFDIRQFLVRLYDCVPNIKNYYRVDGLLKDVNVLQKGIRENPASPLYKETREREHFWSKKHIKITKREVKQLISQLISFY